MPVRLCQTCTSFDLRIGDFDPWGRTRRGGKGNIYYYSGDYNVKRVGTGLPMGELAAVAERRHCQLCMLVVSILELQKPGILHQKTNIDPITEKDTGDPVRVSLHWVTEPLMDQSWTSGKGPIQPLMLGISCSTLLHVDSYLVPSYKAALLTYSPARSSHFYARPRGNVTAKTGLASFWMHTCLYKHGRTCMIPLEWTLPKAGAIITFIDTTFMCLVRVTTKSKYAALSYTWGDLPFFKCTRETVEKLHQEGSLNSFPIPATIADAIKLTRSLGIRYLWVDSLCIVQDDPAVKQQLINMMDTVFSHSYVTITAMDSPHANAGLFVNHYPFSAWGAEMEPNFHLQAIDTYISPARMSNWAHNERAWT
jgi:hypothetical protein